MKDRIKIGDKYIGDDFPVFIIAEIGSNHDQDLNKAKKLIDIAYEAGADAVKFQLFDADELYNPGDELYDIFKKMELNTDWILVLKNYAEQKGLIFFASPFDEKSIHLLDEHEVVLYKWASSETTNLKNLRIAASKNKPMIISTGMCDLADIYESLEVCKAVDNDKVIFLHTSSLYPTEPDDANLNTLKTLKNTFQKNVGFSDHTMNSISAVVAVAHGASVIEKHITLDKKSKGPDHFYASEPNEFKQYVKDIRVAEASLGSGTIQMHPKVREIARRKSLFAKTDIKKGEIIKKENITIKRPPLGISPRFISAVIGAKAKKPILTNKPITWDIIE
jgi:sialic acid synthase SpsE